MAKDIEWIYQAKTVVGDVISGIIIANTESIARVKICSLGHEPISIIRKSRNKFLYRESKPPIKNNPTIELKDVYDFTQSTTIVQKNQKLSNVSLSSKDVMIFLKQFLIVIKSGLPLLNAFDLVIQTTKNCKFKIILQTIKQDIESGISLSQAFSTYPKVFDDLLISFLVIGESSGILEQMLVKYIDYKEKTHNIIRKVKSALIYPSVILFVAFFVLCIILGFVIPQFEDVFQSVGAELPTSTLLVIAFSKLVIDYWWFIILQVFVIIIVIFIYYQKSVRFRFFIDRQVLRIPIFGDVIQKTLISRWTRVLSMLFVAGIPLNHALRSAALIMSNSLYGATTFKIKQDIESGVSFSKSMYMTGVFPTMVNQMVAIGEESGTFDTVLISIANYYEEELDVIIETILSMIEPATIILLGVVLGSIIIAIYLPLFNIGNII